jgi:anti-sigma factor RsiW
MNVTREVIIDLWPAYTAGEASADTRALVEEFLRQDPEFARLLQQMADADLAKAAVPTLPPDHEAQALNRTKRQLQGLDWSLILWLIALSFTFQAFARIVADTSWDVSPRNFIIYTLIAAGFWCAYVIRRMWLRRRFFQKTAKPGG